MEHSGRLSAPGLGGNRLALVAAHRLGRGRKRRRATFWPCSPASCGGSGWPMPAERPDPAVPPFQGGMIGFFGYDLAPLIERLPRRATRDSRLPDIRLALYDTAVIVDALVPARSSSGPGT